MRLTPVIVPIALITASLALAAAKKPDADAAWNVADPHGPSHRLTFTTDEATWMTLDVDPAGQRSCFRSWVISTRSLLPGVPRRGSEAAPPTTLSRAISTEKDDTVNGPTWSKDGEYLVGRKRLTDGFSRPRPWASTATWARSKATSSPISSCWTQTL